MSLESLPYVFLCFHCTHTARSKPRTDGYARFPGRYFDVDQYRILIQLVENAATMPPNEELGFGEPRAP